jgi:peptidoglycan/xylan/chitin deacetylase (PgdA/CDA1 family)
MDRTGRLPAGIASVTFDDGFASTHEYAMPALLQEGLSATVFVVAGTLGERDPSMDWVKDAPTPRRALSAGQILELRDAGFEIGSHSYTHRDLPSLTESEVAEDLRQSREVLEDLVGRSVTLLAYPRGRHDARVRKAAETAGYRYSFAMARPHLPVGLPHAIPRVGIYRGDGRAILYLKTSPRLWRVRNSALQPIIARVARLRPDAH